jgi:tRNA G18 (ribose-2'-O)-methylase SpoU
MLARQLSKEELRKHKYNRNEFKNIPRQPIYIVLDNLISAHNIGTILRMADAVLAVKVFLCGSTITPPSKKLRKASRGAENWVEWEYHKNTEELLGSLKQQGIHIVGLELSNKSIEYHQAEYHSSTCFVVGSETNGISSQVLNLCEQIIHLPMLGMMNSLNVATATSVVLFHCLESLNGTKL